MIVMAVHEFAAERRGDQDSMEKDLYPEVSEALQVYPATNWYAVLLAEATRLYIDTYHREGGSGRPPGVEAFIRDVRNTLDKTENPTAATADRISVWLATAILNSATQEAAADDEEFVVMEWVTMHDSDVRSEHKAAEGQQRPPGEPFTVGGIGMRYPGDPTAPIELWINCRCTLAPVLASEAEFRKNEGVVMTATETESEQVTTAPLAWHGILAPEGVWSGDGRQFAPDALRFRDLPLPLTWQKSTEQGHDGSVVVGKIETIDRVDGMMNATGTFLATPEADEVIGLIAEFGRFGVSVDADDAEFEFDESDGKITFTSARIASASVVSIPAFAEAFVALGPWTEEGMESEEADPCDESDPLTYDPEKCAAKKEKDEATQVGTAPKYMMQPASMTYNGSWISADANSTWNVLFGNNTFVSEESWDGSAGRFTPQQWKSSCVLHTCDGDEKSCHKLPIKEPGGALSRAGVHAAAARFNQVEAPAEAKARAKASLRGAYKQLGEEPPDVLKADAHTDTFDRGPGWITDPVATKRIHDYWTKPGEEGYAKIGWGKGGDFSRCKALVGEKIAANSPEDLIHLNEICARWHHDALGIWPGEHKVAADTLPFESEKVGAPAVTLVAAAEPTKAPAGWFADPNLTGPTHLTITEEGRVYGHIAEWSTCHIGYDGVCVAPPQSHSGYSYFATGRVLLDDGSIARTGVVSLGGGHARDGLRPKAAMEHYDSTSAAVADVCVGEDDHGIWAAGWIRPGTTEEQVIALRASDVSGDWRDVIGNGDLEMVAALAVNVGGFPVRVAVHDGVQVSLVAAGMLETREVTAPEQIRESAEFWADIMAQAASIMQARRDRLKALTARVEGE
jgi:hypothetical protein